MFGLHTRNKKSYFNSTQIGVPVINRNDINHGFVNLCLHFDYAKEKTYKTFKFKIPGFAYSG